MKRIFGLSLIFAAIGFCLVSISTASAQIKTGGYKIVEVTNDDVVSAANFAVEKQSEEQEVSISLDSIEKAETQTVAGINYRLCLKVSSTNADGERSEPVSIQVVVHKNLQGDFSLKSWIDEDCASS